MWTQYAKCHFSLLTVTGRTKKLCAIKDIKAINAIYEALTQRRRRAQSWKLNPAALEQRVCPCPALRPIWPPAAPRRLVSAAAVAHIEGARTHSVKSSFVEKKRQKKKYLACKMEYASKMPGV